MKVLVTGADGFIGRALVARLLRDGAVGGRPLRQLALIDQRFATDHADARVRLHAGDIADPALLRAALAGGFDCVFHLASVPGGLAERDVELGERVNLGATQELLRQLRLQQQQPQPQPQQPQQQQHQPRQQPPVVVFASSVAVYGSRLPAAMDEATPADPQLSYGMHKLVGELLLRDATRRGCIDGRSLRLPGVVARPRVPSGLLSAYMSDILHALAAGEACVCPVAAQAVSWWMSAACCVDNLLHAAALPAAGLDAQRTWVLPVLRCTMAEVVEALARRYGSDRRALVRYQPDAALQAAFGSQPPLATPAAQAIGFRHDGSVDALLRNALPDEAPPR